MFSETSMGTFDSCGVLQIGSLPPYQGHIAMQSFQYCQLARIASDKGIAGLPQIRSEVVKFSTRQHGKQYHRFCPYLIDRRFTR